MSLIFNDELDSLQLLQTVYVTCQCLRCSAPRSEAGLAAYHLQYGVTQLITRTSGTHEVTTSALSTHFFPFDIRSTVGISPFAQTSVRDDSRIYSRRLIAGEIVFII